MGMTGQAVGARRLWRGLLAGSILQFALVVTVPVWGMLVWGFPEVARDFARRYGGSAWFDIVMLSAGGSSVLLVWLKQCYGSLPRTRGVHVSGYVVAVLAVAVLLFVEPAADAARGPAAALLWWVAAAMFLVMLLILLGLLLVSWKLAGPPWEALQISEAVKREARQRRRHARLAKRRAENRLE